jgi:hypothetical protein
VGAAFQPRLALSCYSFDRGGKAAPTIQKPTLTQEKIFKRQYNDRPVILEEINHAQ